MDIHGRALHFDDSKSAWLRRERGIGFEDIVSAIENGADCMVGPHPNAAKYPHQFTLEVIIGTYVYIVPFVPRNDGSVFLKTLYPSRKATKKLRKRKEKP